MKDNLPKFFKLEFIVRITTEREFFKSVELEERVLNRPLTISECKKIWLEESTKQLNIFKEE